MYLSFDHDKKIAFGLSHKCGSSYLRRYLAYLTYWQPGEAVSKEAWLNAQSPQWRKVREKAVGARTINPIARYWLRLLHEQNKRTKYFLYEGPSRHLFDNPFSNNMVMLAMLRTMALSAGMRYQRFRELLLRYATVHNRLREPLGIDQKKGDIDDRKYQIVLFVRNPYQRLVSGFLHIYVRKRKKWRRRDLEAIDPNCRPPKLWEDQLTFEQLVNEMIENGFGRVDADHFSSQTGGLYRKDMRLAKVFDIRNIDHRYIADLFGRKEIDPFFTDSANNRQWNKTHYQSKAQQNAWTMTVQQLEKMESKPPYQSFYNPELKAKVEYLYKNDFAFMREKGFHYSLEPAK